MNTEEQITQLLRHPPRPVPPAGLKQRLIQDINLSEAGTTQTRLRQPAGRWFRRWWPVLAPAGLALGCAVVLTAQQNQIRDLQRQVRGITPTAPAAAASAALPEPPTVPDPRVDEAEVARLKNVAAQLTAEISELERLRMENAELRSRLASAAGLSAEDKAAMEKAREKVLMVQCSNNLKQLGLASKLWALDHDGRFPAELLLMTNEMTTPKILRCPADPAREAAGSWAAYTAANCSYEYLAASASDATEPQRVLFRCPIHGTVGLCDGSVQMGLAKTHPERLVERDGKLYLSDSPAPGQGTADH